MSTGPSFPSESVQTRFFNKGRRVCVKNLGSGDKTTLEGGCPGAWAPKNFAIFDRVKSDLWPLSTKYVLQSTVYNEICMMDAVVSCTLGCVNV